MKYLHVYLFGFEKSTMANKTNAIYVYKQRRDMHLSVVDKILNATHSTHFAINAIKIQTELEILFTITLILVVKRVSFRAKKKP